VGLRDPEPRAHAGCPARRPSRGQELEERNDYIDYELPEDEYSLEKVPTKTKAGGAVKKARATSARARRGRRGRVANTLDPSA